MQVFFKEIVLNVPLGKPKYYELRTEFEERRSPHVHAFVWILDAPRLVMKQNINLLLRGL